MSKNLDEIDLKILSEIQADGRITNVELAKRAGISPVLVPVSADSLESLDEFEKARAALDEKVEEEVE